MPDIRHQDAAASKSKHDLYSLDELLANASTSRLPGDDEFTQIRSESKVVGVGPSVLPKAGLRFHQPANGWKILTRRLSNHASRPSYTDNGLSCHFASGPRT